MLAHLLVLGGAVSLSETPEGLQPLQCLRTSPSRDLRPWAGWPRISANFLLHEQLGKREVTCWKVGFLSWESTSLVCPCHDVPGLGRMLLFLHVDEVTNQGIEHTGSRVCLFPFG